MNFIMIIGIIIMGLDIIWGIYSLLTKRWPWKKRVVFLLIAFMGAGIVQYGDNLRKMTFTKEELVFIQENKNFSSFTDEDVKLYYRSLMTFNASKPEIYDKYYSQFLEWNIDKYMDMNKHRELSREEVEVYVKKDMENKRYKKYRK